MINTATITIIVAASGLFCWTIANMGLGDMLIKTFTSVSTNPWVILAIINIFFLLWGCFFPPIMALLIVVPLLLPLVNQVGIDPVHFGVVIVLNLGIGLMLPPMGLLLYLTSSMAGVKPEAMFKELVPFLIAVIMALALFTYVPAVVLWLPDWLMK
jgi:C4-dicarboxylate transporter DctM subunit